MITRLDVILNVPATSSGNRSERHDRPLPESVSGPWGQPW